MMSLCRLPLAAVVLPLGALLGAQVQAQATASEGVATATVSRNVYVAGATVRTADRVEGDFVGFGGRVVADQAIKGDALLAGGSVDVRAPVGDDLRTAGGDVSIESTIGGELFAAGGNVALTRAAQVAQGATLAGGVVTIDGRIAGTLKASAQRIVLNGEVGGDARLAAEQIELGPNARIGGALSHASREFRRAEGAVIGGALTQDQNVETRRGREPERRGPWQRRYAGPAGVGSVLGYLGLLAAAALFVLVFPKFSAEAPDRIRTSPGLSLAIGFGVLVGVPVLAVLLFITVLGIPLGLAALSLYPLLLLVGYLVGVVFVAQRARAALRKDGGTPGVRSTIAFVALALAVLMGVGWLPVAGPVTLFLTTIAGIGACVLEGQRRRQAPSASG